MGYRYTCTNPKSQLKLTTERVKVLKVTGAQIGQIVVEKELALDTVKIDRVIVELRELSEHLFVEKVLKQGLVHVQIFYVKPDHTLTYTAVDLPFSLEVNLPDFEPCLFTDIQSHLLDLTPNYNLLPALETETSLLQIKVVGHLLVNTGEWTEIDVVTRVDLFPKQL
ncbi:MAG: hypothetical protein PVG90_10550 [Bacillota bacterium]|jgi:hypothetical protein